MKLGTAQPTVAACASAELLGIGGDHAVAKPRIPINIADIAMVHDGGIAEATTSVPGLESLERCKGNPSNPSKTGSRPEAMAQTDEAH